MTKKPDLTRVWASGAASSNIEDPDVTVPGKFAAGWKAEIPPFENFNYLQQLFTQALAHANEYGIMQWDKNTSYALGGLARSTVDNEAYVSLISNNQGNEPSASLSNWGKSSTLLLQSDLADLAAGRANTFDEDSTSKSDKYVLKLKPGQQKFIDIFDGFTVSFVVGDHVNTGSAVTLDVSLLFGQPLGTTIKPVKTINGHDPNFRSIKDVTFLIYNEKEDRFELVYASYQTAVDMAAGRANTFDEDMNYSKPDNYVLKLKPNQQEISAPFDGLMIAFSTTNKNTGGPVTIDISQTFGEKLGTYIKPVKMSNGGDPIKTSIDDYTVFGYDKTKDRFQIVNNSPYAATTHFNPGGSLLISENVQSAIDEIALTTFGRHQSWQDMTNSRELGGQYKNDTTRPIQICPSVVDDDVNLYLYTTHATLYFAMGAESHLSVFPIVIPIGYDYRLEADPASTLLHRWYELR